MEQLMEETRRSHPAPKPPGPKGHWLSGNLPDFIKDRFAFFRDCAQRYGDVVALRFGPRRVYFLFNPADIESVLVTHNHNFTKHFALRLNPLVLGKGLLTSEGDFWLRQRRLSQPAFAKQRIHAYGPTMVRYTERMLAGWGDGEKRDLLTEMMQLTLGIAAKTLFDADVEGKAREVGEALTIAQETFAAQFNSILPLPVWVPTPRNRRMRNALKKLDDIIYGFIRLRRASRDEKGDLLSLLLRAQDVDDSRMTDRQLRDEAMTLFLAGHETTALTLSWAGYALSRHPRVEERLLTELRTVLGGRAPTVGDLTRLRYAEAVINETLRLYPPAYTIGREAIAACEIGGFRVPAGTTLLLPMWIIQRDPRWFDRAEEFAPDRWLDGLAQRIPKFAFFPFGGGPRICIGNTFAMMEGVLLLATMMQQYHLDLDPGHTVRPKPSFTLRPANGIKVILRKR